MQLHPIAYTREAERLAVQARIAANMGEWRAADRLRELARAMARRAN